MLEVAADSGSGPDSPWRTGLRSPSALSLFISFCSWSPERQSSKSAQGSRHVMPLWA